MTSPSLLDLDLGFLALPRRLCGSPLFESLRADERYVAVTMLLRARFAPGEFYFAGRRYPLTPGQFIDSEETIASAAGSTRKVVRSVLRKLSGAGVITRTRAHPAGQCPHVTTIVGYERIRLAADEAGPRTGHEGDVDRAKNGPADGPMTGQEGAPIEQGNKGNKETREQGNLSLVAEADASDDLGPFARVAEVWDHVCVPAGFAKARSTPQQRKAARTRMREAGWFEAFSAACEYVAREPFYRGGSSSGWVLTLGWLLKPGNTEKTAERAATQKAPTQANGGSRCTAPASPPSAFRGGRRDLSEEEIAS